jgi:hypothetical protein
MLLTKMLPVLNRLPPPLHVMVHACNTQGGPQLDVNRLASEAFDEEKLKDESLLEPVHSL